MRGLTHCRPPRRHTYACCKNEKLARLVFRASSMDLLDPSHLITDNGSNDYGAGGNSDSRRTGRI